MTVQRWCEGDRVVHEIRFAPGLPPKRYEGTVIDTGKKGAQVRFDDPKLGVMWMQASRLHVIERAKPDRPARVSPKAEAVEARRDIIEARREAEPVEPAKPVSDLDAWRAMGRDLLDTARAALALAESEASAYEDAVREAERELEEARARVAKRREDLAAVERAVGGQS